jgi:hypothetical protein
MAETVKIPVRDCVGAALRFAVENARAVAVASAVAAAILTLLTGLALIVAPLGLLTSLGSTFVRACLYAVFIAAVLYGAGVSRGRIVSDGARVWAAMAIVGFFMFIVMFVASIPGMIVLLSGPLAPYTDELTSAGQDQAAVVQIMTQFAQEQPFAVLLFVLFYAILWLLLTSRLYLAAPASVDAGRVLTFDTWRWTRGAVMQITWARLMLLAPAYVLVSALDYLVAQIFGVNVLDPATVASLAQANPVAFLGYAFATTFITFAIYSSLEAGLSTSLYRVLRQEPPAGKTLDQVVNSD